MRFATRVLLLQLLTVVAVVAVSTVVFVGLAVQQLRHEAESAALSIARTVAAEPAVRAAVAEEAAAPADLPAQLLAQGNLQKFALGTAESTGALFVVIVDSTGTRLAHPDENRLDQPVSTSYAEALAGREVTAWESGTLGASARAKVPIFAPDSREPVGEVSVGFERAGVFDDLPAMLFAIGATAVLSLLIGTGAALRLRHRWEQLTLGVQPEELVSMVQNQAAVLDGVGDGVIALDEAGVIRVANGEAERMFGLVQAEGMSLAGLGLPAEVVEDLCNGRSRDGIVVRGRVLYLDIRSVDRGGQSLGAVIIARDRTDIMALSERLDSVRAMTSALRVQRHEFANRMHVAAGLVEAGRMAEAADFLRTMRDRGPVDYPLEGGEFLAEPFLHSFLGAKSIEAAERGVILQIRDESLVLGEVEGVEDTATVLGNLVDNAVAAALKSTGPQLVEVTALDEGPDLVLVVADSGPGITPGVDVFNSTAASETVEPEDRIHGHGIGLALSRDLVHRRGGELWIIDPGGEHNGRGAVFGVKLPGVMTAVDDAVAGGNNEAEES